MAPLSERESVTANALNYNGDDNNNNKRGDISKSNMTSTEPNKYLSSSSLLTKKTENSSCSSPSSTSFKQLKKTRATNQANKQVTENSDCNDAREDDDKDEIEIVDANANVNENENEFEQPKRASSDAKALKVEAKRLSRCLSSNETLAPQQQQQDEKLKVVLQDKGSIADVKGTREDPQSISQNPSSSFGNFDRSSLEQAHHTNPAKNIATKNKVSTVKLLTSQQVNVDPSRLEATDINGSGTVNKTTTTTATTTSIKSSTSGSQQQRQMFSLKQLAINPRSLTKKRCSLQTGASSSNQDSQLQPYRVFPKLFDCSQIVNHSQNQASSNECQEQTISSSSGSSSESTNKDKLKVKRSNSKLQQQQQQQFEQHTTGESGNDDQVLLDDVLDGNKENLSFLDELDDLSDEQISDDDNEEDNDHDDDNNVGSDDGQDSDSQLDNDIDDMEDNTTDENLKRQAGTNKASIRDDRRKEGQKKRSKRRQHLFRRSSCCNCEQLINKIDCDGLPVTDVDLVSYKDLCQMEQQAHHMRTSAHHGRQHLETPGCASTLSRTNYGGWQSGSSIRRSSLQEESGAYYELCTSGDEQVIRQKYAWFPPSLKQLHLVDNFFENFPKDKIPFASQAQHQLQNLSGVTLTLNKQDHLLNQQQQQQQHQLQDPKIGGSNKPQTGVASSLAASSYRDEQISSQLPRQDISLDYCSYPMSDSSRAAYMQFVDKRNSQALDVGNVVQVKLSGFSQNKSTTPNQQSAHSNLSSGWQIPSPVSDNNKQFQRRVSTVSQSALLSLNQVSQHEQLGRHSASSSGAQRCRRCLVRFEDKQLAVMAPNFVIGSTSIYRSSVIPSTSVVIEGQATATTPSRLRDKQTVERERNLSSSSTTTAATSNVALYHPNCFTCSTCKEFLVDLVYCLRDNKLYCVRHYGESLKPRCSWCQELIFSDEYLKAMNESFHVDHFLCRHCDSNLAGQRYVLKEEKPFCIQCYEGNFANICEDCQKPIGIDSRDLSYKDRHWHDTCFSCNKCQQSLIDKPFGSKTDKVYCADCYDNTFATRCDGCKNPFRAGSKKMEYRGKQWHDSCFCCCICQNTIGSNSFIPKNEEIYCIKCYEDKFATKCIKCKQVIVSGGVTFRNEPWHRDCFNCCNCNKSLAGQRFTTRDVKNETVKNTNKTNQPHNAYCIDCYGELFAKKCFACTQAITGLGGTRFVTFEDRSWHNDCFLCNDCNTSLVGKGFITDGPETILCGECARAKLR